MPDRSLIDLRCAAREAGSVAMVSLRSRQLLFNLKMNGTARSAAFSPDGRDLLTMGASESVPAAVSYMQRAGVM